jgi:N-acetylneuraminate synthase
MEKQEINLEPTVVATSLGTKVIERHVTLDYDMWGTNQSAGLMVSAMAMLHGRMKEGSINHAWRRGKEIV